MNREEAVAYITAKYGVTPDQPWPKYPENLVFRHRDTKKWFALLMPVRADKLGLDSDEYVDVVTVKCDPFLIDALVSVEGYHRAYHMNKSLWLTIELNWNVPDEKVKNLIDMSFDLTDKKK